VTDATELDKVKALERAILARARTWLPGEVVSYDSATGRAYVRVGLTGQTPTPVGTLVDPPTILPNVHVAWLRGGGSGVSGTLLPNDPGILLFSHRGIDPWLVAGGTVPLTSDRSHELIDAAFVPGLGPLVRPPPIAAAAAMQVGREDGTNTLALTHAGAAAVATLTSDAVLLGSAAAVSAVALADQIHAYLVAMFTAANIAGSANVGAAAGEVEADACLAYLGAHPFAEFAATRVRAL
jgi:hypothetical protein